MNILEVQNLCKTYGKGEAAVQALRDVTFSVHKGEFVAIVGESGSGKSTLLNVVGALDNPTAGKVLIDLYHSCRLFGGCYVWACRYVLAGHYPKSDARTWRLALSDYFH